MDVKEVRRLNLIYLIETVGKVSDFSSAIGLESPNYVSQLKSKRNNKSMGDQFARKIEVAFQKPTGWMDTLQTSEVAPNLDSHSQLNQAVLNTLSMLEEANIIDFKSQIDANSIAGLILREYKRIVT